MAQIALKGNPAQTAGTLPAPGTAAPDFDAVKTDLSLFKLSEQKGTRVVINLFPSIDTGVCATSTRVFNEKASSLENTIVVCASMDLPFALDRFCGAEGLDKVLPLSLFRSDSFDAYSAKIIDGPLAGLQSRAVIVVNEEGTVVYTEQVPEITQEPDYEAAINALG